VQEVVEVGEEQILILMSVVELVEVAVVVHTLFVLL